MTQAVWERRGPDLPEYVDVPVGSFILPLAQRQAREVLRAVAAQPE